MAPVVLTVRPANISMMTTARRALGADHAPTGQGAPIPPRASTSMAMGIAAFGVVPALMAQGALIRRKEYTNNREFLNPVPE